MNLVSRHIENIQLQIGMKFPETGHMAVHLDIPQRPENAYIQLCRFFHCQAGIIHDFPKSLHPLPDAGKKTLPLFREMAAPGRPFNELYPQNALQMLDLGAESGLGNIGFSGSPGEIACPPIDDKALHLLNGW